MSSSQVTPRSKRGRKSVSYKEDAYNSKDASHSPPPPSRRKPQRIKTGASGESLSEQYRVVASHANTGLSPSVQPSPGSYKLAFTRLPHEILSLILRFACSPLLHSDYQLRTLVNWVIETARTCKSFLEPILSILYETPPLNTRDKPHKLLQLLRQPSTTLLLDYKRKIRHLEIQADKVLAYSLPGSGHFSIAELIDLLPCLSAIDISNAHDMPPYRKASQTGRWFYPRDMFLTMERCGIRLERWRWNGDMAKNIISLVSNIHLTIPFQSLRHLSLSHFKLLGEKSVLSYHSRDEMLFSSLVPLTQLESISFESCSSDSWVSLLKLQCVLISFQIINCSDFNTECLAYFLRSYGRRITSLRLNHNQSLSIDFFPELATCCPRLQYLMMDCALYSAHFTHKHNSHPHYDTLLTTGYVPTWPSGLQKIELLNLRKWSREAAEVLFSSLIASAASLSHLRDLEIRVMLDISWRERAEFREKWIKSITSTFLRNASRPEPSLPHVDMAGQVIANNTRRRNMLRTTTSSIQHTKEGSQRSTGGLCDKVHISIDNLRPTEFRFSESDFVD